MLSLLPALAGVATAVIPSILGLLKTSPKPLSTDTRIVPYRGRAAPNDLVALKSAPPIFEQVAKSVHIGNEIGPLVKGISQVTPSFLHSLVSSVRGRKASAVTPHYTNPVARHPASRKLVGVHPNPGPKHKAARGKKKKSKQKGNRSRAVVSVGQSFRGEGPQGMSRLAAPTSVGVLGRRFIQMISTGMPDSIKVVGHMYMADISVAVTGVASFANQIRGGINGNAAIALHPTWIAPPITTLATSTFLRYRFLRATLHYIPACSTTQTGVLSLGYSADGNTVVQSTFTRTTINSLSDSTQGPFWAPIDIPLNLGEDGGMNTYFSDASATGTGVGAFANNRTIIQGSICLCSDVLAPLVVVPLMGSVWITFELVMFGLGITSALLDPGPPPPTAHIENPLYDQQADFEMVSVSSGLPQFRQISRPLPRM